MDVLTLIQFGIVGILAGLLAGLLGMSGGVIVIPCLFYIFHQIGLPAHRLMHIAIGTSLASMVFNTASSTLSHHRNHKVRWDIVLSLIPGIVIGAFVGAFVAYLLPDMVLRMLFGFSMMILGVYLFFVITHHEKGKDDVPSPLTLSALGLGLGTISTLLGVGGGIFVVPLLIHFSVKTKKAIGTAAATSLFLSFLGALGYLFFGLRNGVKIPDGFGYIYLPAFIIISAVSVLFAPLGARLARISPSFLLRKIFGVALVLIGLSMVFL